MKQKSDRSIVFARVCIIFFAVLLAGADLFAWQITGWLELSLSDRIRTAVCFYLCSIAAWAALYAIWRLFSALSRDEVFVPENIRRMGIICGCCFTEAVICAVGIFTVKFFLVVPAAATAFMGLIVLTAKNAFAKAMDMKDELDLTV